jgi:ADP-ribose pyrophosphatase YjhB (NUDIX family)
MPGGFIDVGDAPSEAAVREAVEEAGVVARVRRLAGVFDTRLQPDCPPHLFHIHKLVFTGVLLDPNAEPRAGSEATEARYWPVAALPELSLGRTLPLHVREALRVARDPNALPYFD